MVSMKVKEETYLTIAETGGEERDMTQNMNLF